MANCLVTKLKESVNNDNLEYFDHLHFRVDSTDLKSDMSTGGDHYIGFYWADGNSHDLKMRFNSAVTEVTPAYNGYFKTYNSLARNNIYLNRGVYDFYIPNKSILTDFCCYLGAVETYDGVYNDKANKIYINIEDFKYCPNIKYIYAGALYQNYWFVTGDLSALLELENLKRIWISAYNKITYTQETLAALQEKGVDVKLSFSGTIPPRPTE